MKNYKSLVESFLSLSVLNGLVILIPLVAMPYVLRVVGPANYGLYGFIYILVQYVLVFNNYGFDFSATKEIAQHRNDPTFVNRVYNAVL
ncbi:MAG: oligosaccharide flippase family protein, partial [Bacteroidales bacterium]|nr:oligosaccharide flippase family protein [Bacteroidales bacterium]